MQEQENNTRRGRVTSPLTVDVMTPLCQLQLSCRTSWILLLVIHVTICYCYWFCESNHCPPNLHHHHLFFRLRIYITVCARPLTFPCSSPSPFLPVLLTICSDFLLFPLLSPHLSYFFTPFPFPIFLSLSQSLFLFKARSQLFDD